MIYSNVVTIKVLNMCVQSHTSIIQNLFKLSFFIKTVHLIGKAKITYIFLIFNLIMVQKNRITFMVLVKLYLKDNEIKMKDNFDKVIYNSYLF